VTESGKSVGRCLSIDVAEGSNKTPGGSIVAPRQSTKIGSGWGGKGESKSANEEPPKERENKSAGGGGEKTAKSENGTSGD